MKKIVLIIDSLVTGGAETANLRIADMFIEKQWEVHMIIIKNTIELNYRKEIKLSCLYFKKRRKLFNYHYYAKKLNVKLRQIGEADLIIGSLGLSHTLMNRINNKYSFFYAVHGILSKSKLEKKRGVSKLRKKFQLKSLYSEKRIISASVGIKKDFLSLGIVPKSIQTIYNPFDFQMIRKKANAKIYFRMPNKYIVHVGRFAHVKRQDLLVKAFKQIRNTDIHLVFIGDGEEKNKTVKLVEKLKLQDRVIFLGHMSNPYPIIKRAQGLVLSSESEGFGNVLVEALILNTVAISFDCPEGPREILNENLLARHLNVKSLAKKIDYYSHADSSQEIEKINLKRFDQNHIYKKYLKLQSL